MINPMIELKTIPELNNYLHTDVNFVSFKRINKIFVFSNFLLADIRYCDGSSLRVWKENDDKSGIYGGKLVNKKRYLNTIIRIYALDNYVYARWRKDVLSFSYIKSNKEDIYNIVKEIIQRMVIV